MVDSFDIENGRRADSQTIIDHLSSQISEERLARIDAVVAARTYSVIPVVEGKAGHDSGLTYQLHAVPARQHNTCPGVAMVAPAC